MKKIHIIGGGTVSHIRNHLALAAPAYGTTARRIREIINGRTEDEVKLHLTRMAQRGRGQLETNENISELLDEIIEDPESRMVFLNAALVDYKARILGPGIPEGKYARRLQTRDSPDLRVQFLAKEKLLGKIRKERKDIFTVGFKTTTDFTEDQQYVAGLRLLKESSANLVLANDVITRTNMIVTPEEARYHVTENRVEALEGLVDMALMRSQMTFTRHKVVPGERVPWDDEKIAENFRTVVNHCVERGAYKPVNGVTVGHFSHRGKYDTYLSSIRKSDFNNMEEVGMVIVEAQEEDGLMIAYGAKPSAGGKTQRRIFEEHPEYDSIIHFHCPIKKGSEVPVVSQREFECGSHQCATNTTTGLKQFGNLSAVYLDQHGPNIVWNSRTNPSEITSFIEDNFVLEEKTGGLVNVMLPFEDTRFYDGP